MAGKDIRMIDIAQKLGVSVVTVSKALSDKDGVGSELKAKIKETAMEMGYRKKSTAELTDKAHTGTIGIVLAEHYLLPEHSFYWALYLRTTEALKKEGYYCLLEIVKPDADAPDFVEQGRVNGVMILGGIDKEYLIRLKKSGLPVVLMDFYYPDAASTAVIADSFLGGFYVTKYLIENGHTEIGYLGSIDVHMHAQDMYYGYCKAHRAYGLPLRDEWVLPDREGRGFREEYQLPENMPTAFVCSCDQSAYHFSRDLAAKGLRIPQDVSITGFYDHVYATLVTPQLTTYRINLGAMADKAVDTMLELQRQDGSAPPRHIIVGGSLITRESVLDRR